MTAKQAIAPDVDLEALAASLSTIATSNAPSTAPAEYPRQLTAHCRECRCEKHDRTFLEVYSPELSAWTGHCIDCNRSHELRPVVRQQLEARRGELNDKIAAELAKRSDKLADFIEAELQKQLPELKADITNFMEDAERNAIREQLTSEMEDQILAVLMRQQ